MSAATAVIVPAVCQANDHGFGGIRVPKQKRDTDIIDGRDDEFDKQRNSGSDSKQTTKENRADYLEFGVPLYEASINGDWETAKLILDKRPELVRFGICRQLGTALHVAATADETKLTLQFVKNLVNRMTTEELKLQNQFSNTAFWIAASTGNVNMAMIMMEKNRSLQYIRGLKYLPLSISALKGKYRTVKYLYDISQKMTGDPWTDEDRESILVDCVERELFDVALQILNDCPELAATVSLLEVLARKPDAFTTLEKNIVMRIIDPVISSLPRFFHMKVKPAAEEDTDALKLMKIIWRNVCETADFEEIEDLLKGPPRILFVAAERGNARFIAEVLRTYPDLMFDENEDGLTIFHIAVMHRHHDVYNLMYEIGSVTNDICLSADPMGNFMHHLVGKSSKEMTAKMVGASLLMQRELLWFKEVEKIMPAYLTEEKNYEGQTAYELFSKENEDLVSSGLKWMKDCMVVATLIVTVAFAVAFTVPGGYRQETGFPFFIHDTSFLVFVIADAISLFFSTISLLVFLGVLTSRHGQRDFMYSLPRKLMIGLLALFISVSSMMVTFGSSFFVLYNQGLKWVPILIATFAAVPVIVFAVLQFPLLIDMFRSTITDIKSALTEKALQIFCQTYHIPDEVHPQLPNLDQTIHEMPRHDYVYNHVVRIGDLTMIVFAFARTYYHIHISQLSVIGAAKVSHFEVLCRAHGFEPTVGLFRCLYVNSKNKGWMSFSKRPGNDAVCYIKPLDSLKNWNDRFFWVDAFAYPASFPWNTSKSVPKDPFPKSFKFNAEHYATLVAHPAPFHKYPKPFLCLVGISRYYTLDENTYPQFLRDDDEEMDLLSFIRTADPTKVRIGERQRGKDEPKLLDTIVGRTVPLLPVAPARAESELDASVDRLFDEGGSGTQAEQGDSAGGGGDEQDIPRRLKKRKTTVSDAGRSSHPPKKLREDHETLSGASVGGKSKSMFQQLLAGAVQIAVVRGEPILTLPFVTSSVSATPEHEEEDHTDSLAGVNLYTIGAPQRFVMSSDSSHHSGANIVEAEADSFIRPSVPLMTMTTTVTSTVDPNTTAKEKLVESAIFGDGSSSGADHTVGGFSGLTGSDFIVVSIRIVVSPNTDFQKVYVPQWSVTNSSRLDDGRTCREMVDEFAPPRFFASIRGMEHDQLFTEFNGKRRLSAVVEEKNLLLKTRDEEVANLKAQLLVKEAEATEAIRLRAEVQTLADHNIVLEREKGELDIKVADLAATVKLMVPIHHSPDQTVVGATSLSFSLDVSQNRVRRIKENIANDRSALRDVFVPLAEPLSIAALEGTAGTSGTAPGTTTALSVTFASTSTIPPISTDDYEVVHTDGQEGTDADGQTGTGADANPFPSIDDAELNVPE
ncbi:ankyrin repeat-containing protein [Tanacetum coccineum]